MTDVIKTIADTNAETTAVARTSPASVAPSNPWDLLVSAVSRGVPIDLLQPLNALYKEWVQDERRAKFYHAFARAKAEMPLVRKTKQVGYDSKRTGGTSTRYRYEDLAEIVETVTPPLSKYGLAHWFETEQDGNMLVV